ncbi:PREDICTED: helicase protein MOM1-like isoform X3 [Prunus mume]|uniref:Helicase protein MOM1-like isoform X3 n=1 Tax=Prunus mume TaxID=102107 RepID=A0ABM1LWB4_PRUMU|nr:PREDICTED: helicase protein MOM1-like isoform X3 [Prunus mume]
MAHDTRSSRKIKDDENNNSNGRQISSKGLSTSGSGASDTSGLRRSSRETSLKKNITLSPSSTRKSERLEKKMPETPLFKRKSERFEKKLTPSPLRRSDRAKNHSSTSSGSKRSDKSSGSSMAKRKTEKKEKSVKELTLGTREVSKSEKQNVGPCHGKNKIRNARAYKTLFMKHRKKLQARDHSEKQSRQNKVSQGGSNACGSEVEGLGKGVEELNEEFVGRVHDGSLVGSDSSVNKLTKETWEDNPGVDLSHSSPRPSCLEEASEFKYGDGLEIRDQRPLSSSYNAMMEELNDAPERVHVECSAMEELKMPELTCSTFNERVHVECSATEKLKMPELTCSMFDERLHDVCIASKIGHRVIPSKRKRNVADGDSDSPVNASKDVCTLTADAVSSLPSGSTEDVSVETCGACFKRQRVENDPMNLEFCSCSTKLNQELCGASVTEQKEFSADLQTNGNQNTCLICSLGGKLLFCDGRGCKRSYHLSCLDPPMDAVPLGVWHCSMCVRKKIESGIYSVSEGIESIWDAREVEVSDVDGLLKRKEFFVKYKGLAHIHNQWVPESKLLLEAPTLVGKFNRNNQVTRWKKKWTVPRRLLQKRLLMSPKQHDNYLREHTGDKLFCHYEWLVKWHGLDYDDATWELENAAFLNSPEGQGLISVYENRHQRAKKASISPETDKRYLQILEGKNCSSVKLFQLPAGEISGFDNTCLDNVNKLRELWHKSENAVVYDQERIAKVVAFILSLQSDAHRPFLIISTPPTLCCWDNEFFHLAPSIDVVVYSGNKDLRRSIRTIDFDEAGGCMMFQVLVTSPEAIIEDKNVFECIRWETIIIDECQRPTISKQLVQIKMLRTHNWLLLVNGIFKENSAAEYFSLLSVLDSHGDSQNGDHLLTSSGDIIGKLKERFSRYIAYGDIIGKPKPDSSRFIEYWVPVCISTVQLEQYCENLLSNSTLILSSAKKDRVGALGALHDIVLSARKCCDHPYIVHPPLQTLLTKDLQAVEYLDVGVKASGKLWLLDMMLKEIKNRSLRVLILFQSISGSGSAYSLGDILDDFLRQRYGENSYERVEFGVLRSKKDVAMNMFNNKENGRFVFLLEAHACLPSIKLSSVDTVIIFGSDWNPHNDIRALQKISLDSQFEEIKVFRLYSTCTMEEKLLVRAKQGKIHDSNVQNISSSMLLWGAPYQFDKLDEFHCCNTPASTANILPEESLLNDVIREFLSILPQDGNNNVLCDFSIISKVQQTGGAYSAEVPLLNELKSQHTGEGQPLNFWTELLVGKHPPWKYCSGLSQRNRKRAQHLDELSKKPEVGSDEVVKKRKKVVNGNDDAPYPKPGSEGKSVPGCKEVLSVDINVLENPESSMFESEERRKLHDAQKSLHQLLKPEILKLCGILQVSDAVKVMVEKFLQYVMSNHHVNREPATILQAFQISLCWTAASFLKQKVDHKESIQLAKKHLNFNCKKEEADYVYSMLRCLKKTFLYRTGMFKAAESPKLAKLSSKDVLNNSHPKVSRSTTSNFQQVKSDVKDLSLKQEKLAQKDVSKSIKDIQKKIQKQITKLIEKQIKERSEVLRTCQEEKAHLEAESVVIRSCFLNNTSMRTEKLKMLEKKIEENKNQTNLRLKRLEASQQEAQDKLKEMGKRWAEEVQSWACVELLNRLPSNTPEPWLECSRTSECLRISEGCKDFATLRDHDIGCVVHSMTEGVTALSQTPDSGPDEAETCSGPIRTEMTTARPLGANGALNRTSSDDQENTASVNPCPKAGITDCANGDFLLEVQEVVCCDSQKVVTSSLPSFEEWNHNADTLPISDGEVRVEVPETLCSTDGQHGSHPLNLSSVQRNPDEATLSVPEREAPVGLHETVSSLRGLQNVVSVRAPSSEQIHVVKGAMPDKEVELGVLETVSSSHDLHNVVSVSPPSSEEEIHVVKVTTPDKEVELGVLETVSSNDGIANLVTVHPPSSGEDIHEYSTEHETVSSSHCSQNVVPVCVPSSEEQVHVVTVTLPDKEVDLAVLQTVRSDDGPGNLASVNPPSDEKISEKATEKENSEGCVMASDSATEVYQQNGVDTAVNRSSYQEMPLVNSPGLQPVALAPGGSVTQEQAQQDKGTLLETSTAVQEGDAEPREKQNTCQPIENLAPESVPVVSSNLSNHEMPDIEPVVQQPLLPSSNTPDHSAPELSSAGGVEIQPSPENRTFNQGAHAPMPLVENLLDLSNQTVSRSVAWSTSGFGMPFSDTRTTPVSSALNSRSINAAPQGASRTPLPVYHDPLQNELERLNKQTDHIVKSHEDTKLRLKTDCDKEIEEAVAEIRRKYEIRFQEIEAEFLLKKKELDSIHNKVLMNKILAEAFRSKCMDLRASGASGAQQDGISSFSQQLVHLSMQDAQRYSPVASSSLASPPAVGLQTSIAPLPSPQTTAPAPLSNPNCTAPPMQTVPLAPALLPSIPTRPPHISSISSPGIPQGAGEIRAPAPHLQPFRPSTSMSNQQLHSNLLATSPSYTHIPRLPPPTQQSVPHNRAHHPESAGGDLAALRSLSALGLLMNMNSRAGANPPGSLPSQPTLVSNHQSSLSEPPNTSGACVNPVHTSGSTDIVCLSDDD